MDLIQTGKLIAESRKEKGLTQEQLANKLFVTKKAVSKWECGKGFPDVSILERLGAELDLSVNELLSGKKLATPDEYIKSADKNLTETLSREQFNKNLVLIFTAGILGFFVITGLIFLILKAKASSFDYDFWLVFIGFAITIIGFVLMVVLYNKKPTGTKKNQISNKKRK